MDAFLPRARFALTVVDHNGWVGVRKTFCGDKIAFVNELEAILDLGGAGCRVPEIFTVDFDRLAITLAYINGVVIREALADAGAPMRDRDVKPSHSKLSRIQNYRLEKQRIAAGRSLVERILNKEIIARLEEALLAIHRAHYALGDIKYGNIIVEATTKVPYFIDFEHALPLRDFSRATATYLRDCDAAKLNRLFGTKLITATTLSQMRWATDGAVYASSYAGTGIRRAIWNPEFGIRRWCRVLARHVPVPRDGRVLDLGASNGLNALQMLRAGAGEVIGVEVDRAAIDQGLFFKRVFEWSDNLEYHFSYVRGSHADVPSMNLGRFDLITVFCTPCYVNRNAMAKTVSGLARMTDTFVFQCNDDRCSERRDPETFAKEQLSFNVDMVRSNGFPHVAVIERGGSGHALVIARTRAAANEDVPGKRPGRPRTIASTQRDEWVTSHQASVLHEADSTRGPVSKERSVRRSRL
jgi:tRNA A-37 threonylcarbamoyl transferase component Bud32